LDNTARDDADVATYPPKALRLCGLAALPLSCGGEWARVQGASVEAGLGAGGDEAADADALSVGHGGGGPGRLMSTTPHAEAPAHMHAAHAMSASARTRRTLMRLSR
jgi:hypothetical protein